MSHSSQTTEDNVGLTPLEYARINGLSLNCLTESPEILHLESILDAAYKNITDDARLPHFDFGAELPTAERLTVSKGAAVLLVSVAKEESDEWVESNVSSILGCRKIKALRVEEPLLRSDNETDVKDFVRREGFELNLREVKLPLERVNEEKNEGITWPTQYEEIGLKVTEELRKEKIAVPKSALVFLQDVWTSTWTEDDERDLRLTELKYKKSVTLEPVTPPLSPRRFSVEPYEPSMCSPGMEVPILSDPASLVTEDLKAIEARVFAQDVPTPFKNLMTACPANRAFDTVDTENLTVKLSDIYSPLASTDNPISSPLGKRFKVEDLKVEKPLTPPHLNGALQKCVRFSDKKDEMLLDLPESEEEDVLENIFFEEAFGEAAERANRKLQQERLQEADSLSRVDVPSLSLDIPLPPWKDFQKSFDNPKSLLATQSAFIKYTIGDKQAAWPGVKALLRILRWAPFPYNLAKIVMGEDAFTDGSTWQAFTHGPDENEIVDSSKLTWKPPGLRIVHEREDEEEENVEFGVFEQDSPADLSLLVKKRRMDFECAEFGLDNGRQESVIRICPNLHVKPVLSVVHTAEDLKMSKLNDFISARQLYGEGSSVDLETTSLLGGPFSAGNSLDNYFELRGSKKQKLMDSNYFQIKDDVSAFKAPAPEPKAQQQVIASRSLSRSTFPKLALLPVPAFKAAASPTNVIVASTLPKRRALIKQLEAQIPSLRLVERDFTAHNTTAWLPGSISRSPIASPLTYEADLIVSATTGIIVTTLQKVKQKPLPGQKTKAAIRERVEKASVRYEKLVVLVSEGGIEEVTNGLDESDCLALSEFMGFTLGLEATITVQFVGGGEDTLSKWLASSIVQNPSLAEMTLHENETHWELFLRRAGMNVYAAQVVIETLKAPDGVNMSSPTKAGQFGIAAFLEMGRERRIALFGRTCGIRVLERVSAVIDATWE